MSDFDRLAQDFLDAEMAANPVMATGVGLPGHDDELPDLTEGGIAALRRDEEEWRRRFGALADADLTDDERLDRDLVLASLRRRAVMRDDWQEWRRAADTYAGPVLNGVFLLFLHRLRPEPELVTSAAARLRAAPELLAAGRDNLDPELVAPVLARRALGQARGAVGYLRDGLLHGVDDEGARRALAGAGEQAATAFEGYVTFLEGLVEKARGDFAFGAERYSTVLREAEGLDYGVGGLHQRGLDAYDELAAEMARLTKDIGGGDDWRGLLGRLNDDHPGTPEEMLASYVDWTSKARAFGYEHGLVSEPAGESCDVIPSPAFQRATLAVASYMRPPAFAERSTGTFFVPFPPDGATPEQVQQRLATNSHWTMPSVAVHEAYPGHHWHFARLQAANRRPLRQILGTSYFIEGWALYAERLLREHGFFTDPRQELCHIDMRLFRAARIIVDTALHTGEMTVEEATDFMSTKASLSRETAAAEVARYCAWPTQAASYLTGAMEIQRMRDEWVRGGGDLREFHDALCGSGMLPIGLAERALRVGR
ncbi:MAG TPA: DUF885 domain-containing protein [Mycobacteriales bacterium]|jgi:uncharacterized protein (DUF885 family)|nr:DUF885 domain-containing protein [Mycobacteriales bacterium]